MKILVYGSGDFGQVLRGLAEDCGHQFAGFIDDVHPGNSGVIGAFEAACLSHAPAAHAVALAVGYRHFAEREELFAKVRGAGYLLPALVHPEAYVHRSAEVAAGAVVMARAIADRGARLGEACVLWPGANVSHDAVVGRNTFLSPDAVVCGFATVGQRCFVGAGAVIADHCSVPDDAFIKAGSVVS
jgi:sugar O-acyltransferase (sialic acid O-acetyltransferase NeuD family)